MKMLKVAGALAVVPILAGCASTELGPERTITLRWQRLVAETGDTCDRCSSTQKEVRLAADTLRRCLRPLDMEVALEETPMSPEVCARDMSQSNRIFVDGRPLADWLKGKIAMSACAPCCQKLGEKVQCRTVTVGGRTFETIPAALIVRAGLLAAEASLASLAAQKPCCPE
ncbi:MAG: DUF2703 domain-containing protein [Planctomycetota bacterium]|jgi:hypothetical protein